MSRPTGDPAFASDNTAGAEPAVLAAIADAAQDHAPAYGADAWTERAVAAVRQAFEAPQAEVLPLWGGTGANVLALRLLASRVEGAFCASGSHLVVAETGAPVATAGVQLVGVPTVDGRLGPDRLDAAWPEERGPHHVRMSALSIAQATELGTVYTPGELATLTAHARSRGLRVHVDGARLPHAAAALGTSLAALTTHAGVDVVSFGLTKVGAVGAEALVILDPQLAADAAHHRKQITQLASKMRFLSAQILALLEGERWRDLAGHAQRQAARLAEGASQIDGVEIAAPVQTNAVFARLPEPAISRLRERWAFATWSRVGPIVRWMTSFQTEPAQVDAFLDDLRAAVR